MVGRAASAAPRNPGSDSNIYGRLGSVGLNDIIQLLGLTARTATVSISYQGRQGKIFFDKGRVLHARTGSVSGEDALLRLVNWNDAEFVIEDGLTEPVTPTISKSVDAVMLNVLTQLDESKRTGVPVFTPFPPLDKPETVDLPALERRVRSSRSRPSPPRRKSSRRVAGAVIAAGLSLGAAAAIVAYQSLGVDGNGFPDVERRSGVGAGPRSSAPPSHSGVALDVLSAASSNDALRVDTVDLLASHGVSLDAASPTPPRPAGASEPDSESESESGSRVAVSGIGSLLVVAEPWARITIDGTEVGETPLPAFELAAGEHEIVLSNPNFVGSIRDTLTVERGRTQSVRYSFLDTGGLRILVTPWADVFIDDRHVGQTPMGELQVTLGRHTLVLRHASLGERREVVDIRRGQSVVVEVDLR